MTVLEGMNRAIRYIEEHLGEEIDYGEVARIACVSQYHFQRMFAFVTDIPLSEYIRRRRLTLAAFDLRERDNRIIDIAVKYGYASADAFSRAFQNLHGIAPSKAREDGATLVTYPSITFTLSIKGVTAMNYKIEEKEGFTIVGVREFTTMENGENSTNIPKMREKLPNEIYAALAALSDRKPGGVLGVCGNMYDSGFDYWIAAATSKPCPEGFESLSIPACTWAIFEAVGPLPGAIQQLFTRIFTEWLPTSGFEHAPSPEIEVYSDGDNTNSTYRSYVWIPVVKK